MTHPLSLIILGIVILLGQTGCTSSAQNQSGSVQKYDGALLKTKPQEQLSGVPDNNNPPTPKLSELNESSGLSDYLAYAALNNPGLQAAFNRWKASVEGVSMAGTLPDPRFTYQYYIEEVETRVGPQNQGLGIAQTFPWFGKLKLQSNVAQETANAERQRYESAKLKLFHQVKDVYAEYYYLGQAIRIFQDNVKLLRHLEEVSRSRFKVAAASHPDVIRTQIELGKLADHLKSLEELRGPLQARLNHALNRPIDTEIPWPRDLPRAERMISDAVILEKLIAANPDLKAIDSEIKKNRQKVDLARKGYYPDITLGLNYIDTDDSPLSPSPRDNGKDPVIAMVSINLPLWHQKYDAGVRQARAGYRAAKQMKEDKVNDLTSTLKMSLYQYHDAQRKVDLYKKTLIPKARQSLKGTESDYQSGKVGFLDLIDSQRVLLEFELSLYRALADHTQSLAKIEMLIGRQVQPPNQTENE